MTDESDRSTSLRHTIRYAGRSHPGLVRGNNEDSMLLSPRVLVVADGMGGHAAGEVASRLVADAFGPLADRPAVPNPLTALDAAVRSGNAAIARLVEQRPDLDGMGTTVTALLFDGGQVGLAHVGDSRGYLYRTDVLHQLTHDDTFVQSLVDEGRITEAEAHGHPQRNLVLRALTGLEVEPLLLEREAKVGDRYLLCSDGLCGVVDAESIAGALAADEPEDAVDALIDLALAAGAPDNVTVIVADVVDVAPESAPRPLAPPIDPDSTSPIAQLTREMPRVPLPPIPEEPAAPAEILPADDAGDGSPSDDDYDGPATDAAPDGAGAAAADEPTAAHEIRTVIDASAADAQTSRQPPPRRRWYRLWLRPWAMTVVCVLLVAAVTAGATVWVRHQYYVSDQGNLVVVFRGVNGSLLGWNFSSFEETSCAGETDCTPLKVSDLQLSARSLVQGGIKTTSLADARTVVARLADQMLPLCPQPGDEPPVVPSSVTQESTTPEPSSESPTTREPAPAPDDTLSPTVTVVETTVSGAHAASTLRQDTDVTDDPARDGTEMAAGDAAQAGDSQPGDDIAPPGSGDQAAMTPQTAPLPQLAQAGLAASSDGDGSSDASDNAAEAADSDASIDADADSQAHLAGATAPASGLAAPVTNSPRPPMTSLRSPNLPGTVPTTPSTTGPTVQPTPLAPAALIPGVTCRTGQ